MRKASQQNRPYHRAFFEWRPNHRDLVLILVAGFFSLGMFRAHAQITESHMSGGILQLQHAGQQLEVMAVDSQVSIRIIGAVAEVSLTQQFQNPSQDWVQGQYLFPLPDQAAVNQMRLRVGERLIEGEIQERQQAQEIYNQAKAEGKTASLVAQHRPNLFTTDVANIAPGETIAIELHYIQPLNYQEGQFSLRYPMSITPRYAQSTPLTEAGSSLKSAVELKLQLETGFELVRLESLHHDVQIQQNKHRYQIELIPDQLMSDHDFELVWEPALSSVPSASVFTQTFEGETYALMMVMPPHGKDQLIQPRELILVIDSSGSMQGQSMEQAKQSVAMAIASLKPHDRFNLIEFDSTAKSLFEAPRMADSNAMIEAMDYIETIRADGGTNMSPALNLALSGAAPDQYIRQVVFLTDGAIGNETQLFRQISEQLNQARLFTVGIGPAPNAYFMRKAAEFGHGSYTFIGDVAEIVEKMDVLLSRLEHPAMTDLCLDWSGSAAMYPQHLPDLYIGEPLMIAARLDQAPGEMMVCGKSNGQDWNAYVDLNQTRPGDGLSSLWARRKIESAMDELALGADPEQIRTSVLETALKHQLMSRYTSFVAVDKTPWRVAEDLENKMDLAKLTGQIPLALPQTATDAPLYGFYLA